jgi:DNA-binding HxlR family transcriptional regulator
MRKIPPCPVEATVILIGNKWRILIIRDLLDGAKRFNELKRSVGNISQKVLTENLRNLEENGLIVRTVYNEVPPKVEYSLTKTGMSLNPIVKSIREWGVEYLAKMNIEECHCFR